MVTILEVLEPYSTFKARLRKRQRRLLRRICWLRVRLALRNLRFELMRLLRD